MDVNLMFDHMLRLGCIADLSITFRLDPTDSGWPTVFVLVNVRALSLEHFASGEFLDKHPTD